MEDVQFMQNYHQLQTSVKLVADNTKWVNAHVLDSAISCIWSQFLVNYADIYILDVVDVLVQNLDHQNDAHQDRQEIIAEKDPENVKEDVVDAIKIYKFVSIIFFDCHKSLILPFIICLNWINSVMKINKASSSK